MADLNNYDRSIYPDRYDRAKNWVKILPIPGRRTQTAEIIELQSIQQDNVKQGFDSLFKDGSVLRGLQLSLFSSTDTKVIVSVSSGQIYVQGIVVDVPSTSLELDPVGLFNIGITVTESVIDESDDPTLRDPIKGNYLYGTAGASRLIWLPTVSINDTSAYVIGQVLNGSVIQNTPDPFFQVNNLLSTYTYERAGNFCVRGFDASSVNASQRAVSDLAQYTAIQNAYTAAKTKATTSLSEAITAQSAALSLSSQLNDATSVYNSSPTSGNQLIVANLASQLEVAQRFYSETSVNAVSQQAILQSSQNNLDAAQALLVDQILVSIAPGLAYVGGNRIETTSPTLVTIPKNLPTTQVTDATFTYAGSKGVTSRLILLTGASTFLEVQSTPTLFVITFSNLVYDNTSINITVKVLLSNLTSPSINSFIDYLLQEFNKTSDQAADPTISFSGTQPLEATRLRSIIQSSVTLSRTRLDNIVFTSTAALNSANQINISTQFFNTDNALSLVSASTLIGTDIASSNIYGASQNTTFQLGFTPVDKIISLVANLEESNHPIVRGLVPGTQDQLGASSVISVVSISQGTRNFVEGVDYTVVRQSQIDWSLSGDEPAPGTTYFVTFLYTQALTENKDFTFDSKTSEINFGGGLTPAVNQQFFVTYSYFLALAGVIGLDSKGNFSTTLSQPSSNPVIPSLPPSLLPIASLQIYANRTIVNSTECRTVTYSDLFELEKEIQANTSNIQQLNLNSDSYNRAFRTIGDSPIGMFNDVLQDVSKLDLENSLFTASISPAVQSLTAGYTHVDATVSHGTGGSLQTNYLGYDNFVVLPYTPVNLISQLAATESTPVTVRPASLKKRSSIKISAQTIFNNVGSSYLTTCDVLSNNLSALSKLTNTSDSLVVTSISKVVRSLFKAASQQILSSFSTGNALANTDGAPNTFLTTSITSVSADPSFSIEILVEDLPVSSDGYILYFSGAIVPAESTTVLLGAQSVTTPQGFSTDSSGRLKLIFNIPEGVSPGVHLIEVIGVAGYAKTRISIFNNLLNQIVLGAMSNWGLLTNSIASINQLPLVYADYNDQPNVVSSEYLLGGASPTVPTLSSSITTNSQQFPIAYSTINQTIAFPEYYYITSVDIALAEIPSGIASLNLYLKGVTSELPNNTVYGEATASSYSVSNDGSVLTTFTFRNPVLVNADSKYSISLDTKSEGFSVFIAQVGSKDIRSQFITAGSQLYLKGELVTSDNGINLDSLLNKDLTFAIKRASFPLNSNEIVTLGAYGVANGLTAVSHFCYNTRDIIPSNTSITYQYSTNNTDWIEFTPNLTTCLANEVVVIYVRAILNSTNSSRSALLNLSGTSISLYQSNLTSSVISKRVTYPTSYRNLDIILRYVKPASSSIDVYFSPTSGFSWEGAEWISVPLNPDSVKLIDPALSLYEATFSLRSLSEFYVLSSPRTKFRYRIDFATSDSSLQPLVNQVMTYVW